MGQVFSMEAEGVLEPEIADTCAASEVETSATRQPSDDQGHIDIFVSYASTDSAEIIRNVTATFEARGLRVFNPLTGLTNPTAAEMARHVARAHVCVVAISPNYFKSKWCCIEAHAAMSAKVPVVPVFDGTQYAYAVGDARSDRNPMFWKTERKKYHSLAKGVKGKALRDYVFSMNLLPAISDVDQAKATSDLITAVSSRVPTLGRKLSQSGSPAVLESELVRFPRTPSGSDDSEDDVNGIVAATGPKDTSGTPCFEFELDVAEKDWETYVKRRGEWIDKKIRQLLRYGDGGDAPYVGYSVAPCKELVLANFDCKIDFPDSDSISVKDQTKVLTIIKKLKHDLRKEGVPEEDLSYVVCCTGWVGCLELVIQAPASVLAALFRLLRESPTGRLTIGTEATLLSLEPVFSFTSRVQDVRPLLLQVAKRSLGSACHSDAGALIRLPLLRVVIPDQVLSRVHSKLVNSEGTIVTSSAPSHTISMKKSYANAARTAMKEAQIDGPEKREDPDLQSTKMGTPTSVIGQGDRDQQQPRHGNIDSAQKRDRGKMSVKLDSRGQPRGERRSDKGGRGGRIRGGYGYGGYGGRGGTNESQVRYNMSKIQMAMADLKYPTEVHTDVSLEDNDHGEKAEILWMENDESSFGELTQFMMGGSGRSAASSQLGNRWFGDNGSVDAISASVGGSGPTYRFRGTQRHGGGSASAGASGRTHASGYGGNRRGGGVAAGSASARGRGRRDASRSGGSQGYGGASASAGASGRTQASGYGGNRRGGGVAARGRGRRDASRSGGSQGYGSVAGGASAGGSGRTHASSSASDRWEAYAGPIGLLQESSQIESLWGDPGGADIASTSGRRQPSSPDGKAESQSHPWQGKARRRQAKKGPR